MPPAIFIGAVRSYPNGAFNYRRLFDIPLTVKPGDVMIALRSGDGDATSNRLDTTNNAYGWKELGFSTQAQANFLACARVAKSDDPPTVEMQTNGAFTWEEALLVVYRNLDPAILQVGAVAANNVAASTNFICPSQLLTKYSDLWLGFVAVKADVAITTPVGTTKRLETVGYAAGRRFCAFDFLAETPGATGTKTATTGANQNGVAGSLAIAASGLLGGKSLSGISPVPGMLGLPRRGV